MLRVIQATHLPESFISGLSPQNPVLKIETLRKEEIKSDIKSAELFVSRRFSIWQSIRLRITGCKRVKKKSAAETVAFSYV
jgi:hypothetical protein